LITTVQCVIFLSSNIRTLFKKISKREDPKMLSDGHCVASPHYRFLQVIETGWNVSKNLAKGEFS
jgi:hypothetical protein